MHLTHRKVTAKRSRVPGSRSRSSRQSSSVTVSLILKFGPRVAPDPTIPLQKHLAHHQGKLAAPLNEKATITSIKIIKPGVSPAFLGSCAPSCASKCLMSCNPMCCTSRIVLNSFNPYRYPAPVGQVAKPFKIIKSPQRLTQQWPYAAHKQTMLKNKVAVGQQAPLPIMLSVTCIPTTQNPCPPGMQTPRRFQATYRPGTSTLMMGPRKGAIPRRLPAAPQVPYLNPIQAPCVSTPSNPCSPYTQNNAQNRMVPGAPSYPMLGVPAQVQRPFLGYPGGLMAPSYPAGPMSPGYPAGLMAPAPCVPAPFSPCPPPNRKLSKPKTKKPKSRAQMPFPRPGWYTFPFGMQTAQPIPNVGPYFNPLLRTPQRQAQAIRFTQPIGFSFPSQVPQTMQISYPRPCIPTRFKSCPPQKSGLQAIKVEPAQKKNADQNQKPSEISLTQPMQLQGQIFIHPPPGAMFSPFARGQSPFGLRPPHVRPVPSPCIPSPFNPCQTPIPSKKRHRTKAKTEKKKAKSSSQNPITLSSPLAIMGKVMLGSNAPNYAPMRLPNPCVPSPVNPCIPQRFLQPIMPYSSPPRFRLPVGVQHPFAGLKPLTPPPPPPAIPLFNPLNMQPPRLAIPGPPQPGPSRSLVIQLPPIRINYPNNQVTVSPPRPAPIQQPLYQNNNQMQPAFPPFCTRSCILAPPFYCPSYCPRVCCKKINHTKPNIAKKTHHKKPGKRYIKHSLKG